MEYFPVELNNGLSYNSMVVVNSCLVCLQGANITISATSVQAYTHMYALSATSRFTL